MAQPELTANQAAKLAGLSARHMRHLLATGELAGHKLGAWLWVVSRREIDRWIAERDRDQNQRRHSPGTL